MIALDHIAPWTRNHCRRAHELSRETGLGSFDRWAEFADWAASIDVAGNPASVPFSVTELAAPSPRPRQVIGVGLNYADHAKEAGLEIPEHPVVFTKFASSVVGPDALDPKRFLIAGESVVTEIEGIGTITQRFHA